MLRRALFPVLTVWFLLAALPAGAAENALDAVSTDAGVLVRLKNPNATFDKVAAFLNEIVPGVGDQFRAQSDGIGAAISNPSLAGVDKDADWWLAVYPRGGDQEPEVVFLIPATDLKAMKEGLGNDVKFIEHGKLGVYAEAGDAADRTAGLLKGNGKSIATLIEKDSQTVFDKGDVSVFINVARIYAVYKDNLNESRERLTQSLENVPDEVPGAPGMNPRMFADAALQIVNVLMQGVEDTQSCTIAAMISKEGLAFEDLVRLASGSKTDQLLQKSPPNALSSLGSLPAGALGYLGIHGNISDLAQFGLKLAGAAVDSKNAKDFEAALAEIQKLKYGAIVSSFALGSAEEGALRSASVTEVSDPGKLRALMGTLVKAMGTIETGGMKQTYSLKSDAEKTGQNSVDVLTVTIEPGDTLDPAGADMLDRFMKALYGPEGMITRTVYLKDRVVQANGGGKEALDKLLAALEKPSSGVGGAASYKEARGRLADKANLLVLFDLPGAIAKVIEVVAESGQLPIPINAEVLKGLDLKPSFLGLSLATEPQGLRVMTNVPTDQAQGVAKIVMTLMGAFGAPEN